MNDYFPNVVGQTTAKRKLSIYLKGYEEGQPFPHILFISEKGGGKTFLASQCARNLTYPKGHNMQGLPKEYRVINAGTLSSLNDLVDRVFVKVQNSRHVTFLIDEIHALNRKLMEPFLTILSPNNFHRNTITLKDNESYEFDFHRVSFMFATTNPEKLFQPFVSRCKPIVLDPFSLEETKAIIEGSLGDKITYDDLALCHLCNYVKRNGRAAQMFGQEILSYCKAHGIKEFNICHVEDLIHTFDLHYLGLDNYQISVLKILFDNYSQGFRVSGIGHYLGIDSSTVQKTIEPDLIKNGLIKIDSGIRFITQKGKKYLNDHCKTL